jgi:hypothetical protein
MGGVLTKNEGPQGETYQFYSACGPIVQGYPEPSMYYLRDDPPENVCVKAGKLEFGDIWEQQFAIGLVWFTLITSLALWLYYTWATFKSTCGWEEFYVVNMESARTHLLHAAI